MNHALIEIASGRVVDLFAGELSDLYEPPAGHSLVDTDEGRVGDLYDAKKKTFAPPPYAGPSLDAIKDGLKQAIDTKAEELRQQLVTPGAGQAMEYQEAQAEADRALAALAVDAKADLNPLDYPMLAASVGFDIDPTTGKPSTGLAGSARSIAAVRNAWRAAAAAIRKARLDGKDAIDAAKTEDAAQAAFEAIGWPSFG